MNLGVCDMYDGTGGCTFEMPTTRIGIIENNAPAGNNTCARGRVYRCTTLCRV